MIITAIDNDKIRGMLEEIYEEDINKNDITYMEGVIEYLNKNIVNNENMKDSQDEMNIKHYGENILITKDTLEGNLNKYTYITQIRLVCPKIKVIIFVEKLDSLYKDFLFANNIFNIIEGEYVKEDELYNQLQSNEKIVYRYIDESSDIKENICNTLNEEGKKYLEEKIEKEGKIKNANRTYISDIFSVKKKDLIKKSEENKQSNNLPMITDNIISVFGTSGSGKSTVSNLISLELAKRYKEKIVLFDMDIQNPITDIYNNIEVNKKTLKDMVVDIDESTFEDISDYYIESRENRYLNYIINNFNLSDVFCNISNLHYEKIFLNMKKTKNTTYIIDLSGNITVDNVEFFTQKSDYILFCINPNYISIRQAIKYLEHMKKVWNIDISNIYIVVNNIKKGSLSKGQILNLLPGYQIITLIENICDMESYINGNSSKFQSKINIDRLYKNIIGGQNDKKSFYEGKI